MTTQELKSYIDRILGNNIRLLLPSYWWKRAFGAVIDKVDEKVEKSELKTINGESVIGEGDLRVGVKSVESVEALEKLDAEVGDIATVSHDAEYQEVLLKNCVASVTPKNDWENLTRIRKIEEKGKYNKDISFGIYFSACTEKSYEDIIFAGCDKDTDSILYGHFKYGKTTPLSLDEVNVILSSEDYRFVFAINGGIDYSEQFFSLYTWGLVSDAYIKSDSWEKLSKDHIVASESELNALNAPMGTIAKVTYKTHREIKPSSCLDSMGNWESGERITKVNLSNAPVDNVMAILYAYEGSTLIGSLGVLYSNGEVICEDHKSTTLSLDELNDRLLASEYKLAGVNFIQLEDFDNTFRFYTEPITDVSDAYIKGETWTKLLKEGDATGGGMEILALSYEDTEEGRAQNVKVYNRLEEAYNSEGVIPMLSVAGMPVTSTTRSESEGNVTFSLNIIGDYVSFKAFGALSLNKDGVIELKYEFTYSDYYFVTEPSLMKEYANCVLAGLLPSVLYIDPHQGVVIADAFSSDEDTNIILYFNLSKGRTKVVVSRETGEILSEEVIANATGGGSTPFRIWYSYDLTPAQKEDNVRAYNALMNKETFDFELLYIDEGEDYYSISREVVTGFTCHMDSQKVHISFLVAATEDGITNESLFLIPDGTFEVEVPPL